MRPAPLRRTMRPLTRVTEPVLESPHRFDFVVTGDSRPTLPNAGFPRVTHRLFRELRLLRPAFVLYTGDFMWGYGASRQEMLNDLDRFTALADGIGVPLFNVPGNHEMQTDVEAIRLLRERGHDLFGSFDVGPYHFVALNTDEFWLEGRVTGAQLDWLRDDLAGHRDARATFVFMHRPLFSWFQGDFNPDDAEVLEDLFRCHGVRGVFAAHDHFFQDVERDGVHYMTVAGAGSPMYAQPQRGGFAHYVVVGVAPEGVTFDVVEPGRVDVDVVAGGDGLEPSTTARIANTTDRDLVLRNVELRVPRLASRDGYRLAVDLRDWQRRRATILPRLRDVRDEGDGSVTLSVEVPVETGLAFRLRAEARVDEGPEGEPAPGRDLVVNADDFGRTSDISRGILQAHDDGIVTSTSLMVRWPAAEEAAALARQRPELGVGLHLDLGEWAFRDGAWVATYEVVAFDDTDAIEREARAQLTRFCELLGRAPTHLDSHQHVHTREPVASVARRLADELGIPLRRADPRVRYCGDFYGRTGEGEPLRGAVTAEALVDILGRLGPGITELACHPGASADDDPLYGAERPMELAALTDDRVREAVRRNGIRLRSFAGLARD